MQKYIYITIAILLALFTMWIINTEQKEDDLMNDSYENYMLTEEETVYTHETFDDEELIEEHPELTQFDEETITVE